MYMYSVHCLWIPDIPIHKGEISKDTFNCTMYIFIQNPCLEKGSDQLFVTLNTLSIYPFVHKQLIRTLFEAHIVYAGMAC